MRGKNEHKNISSKAWLEMLEGDEMTSPNTRDNERSKIKFTLEKCHVDESGNVHTVESRGLKWRT